MRVDNLFADIPARRADELVQTLLQTGQLRLERIVSRGHTTPTGSWLAEQTTEWVVLLRGSATLLFDGQIEPVRLRPGDHLTIPAGRRHRVEETHPTEPTVWLALHC